MAIFWFVLRAVVGGLIGYLATRFLKSIGLPLDEWAERASNWLGLAMNRAESFEALYWGLALLGAVILALWGKRLPDVTESLIPHFGKIPFGEAARKAYEETRRTLAGRIAETVNAGDVLGYYFEALKAHGAKFYGMHPPSQKMEAIAPDELKSGIFSDDGTSFSEFHKNKPKYISLHIRRRDLNSYLKRMKSLKEAPPTPPKAHSAVERMPLILFRDEAKKRGWDFDGKKSLDLLDFSRGLDQEAFLGNLKFWGIEQTGPLVDTFRHKNYEPITPEHWRQYKIEPICLRNATTNGDTRTGKLGEITPNYYADLQIEKSAAMRWLKEDAAKYRGQYKGS